MQSNNLPSHLPRIKTTSIDKSTMVMIKSQDTGLMDFYKVKHKFNIKMETISEEYSKKVTKSKVLWSSKIMVHIKVSSPINNFMDVEFLDSKIKPLALLGLTVLSKEIVLSNTEMEIFIMGLLNNSKNMDTVIYTFLMTLNFSDNLSIIW